jgi:hypothetical protein
MIQGTISRKKASSSPIIEVIPLSGDYFLKEDCPGLRGSRSQGQWPEYTLSHKEQFSLQ